MREFICFLVRLKWPLRPDPVLKNKIVYFLDINRLREMRERLEFIENKRDKGKESTYV